MIDIRALQKEFDAFAEKLKRKNVDEELIETLRSRSLEVKAKRQEMEERQGLQNTLSKEFGMKKRNGEDVGDLQEKVAENKQAVARLEEEVREMEEALTGLALTVPNLPDDDVPDGNDEEANVEIAKVLEPAAFDFEPKPHYELGEENGWLDFQRGVKLAKSRFTVMKSEAARLERALINYMLDFNRSRGFEEVWVPAIVNRESMTATGQLPKFEEDLYRLGDPEEEPKNDLFMIPTAEVPLTNLFRDEILKEEELPVKMTAFTSCYRKEAGSAGRDTRGMIRQHQFDKVELVCISKPEESDKVMEEMVSCASDLLKSLDLPHRLMRLCTGDLGFSAACTIDLEVWLPAQGKYREISSVSNCRDFQARRGMIRYKAGKKNTLVHTLNGSSLAVGRTLIAIMENFQNADGTVTVPEALQPYLK